MCNRFALGSLDEISEFYGLRLIGSFGYPGPTGDVYPMRTIPVLICNKAGDLELVPMAFGYSPLWSKQPLTNATVENSDSKIWKPMMRARRCLIPLNAFHEPCYWGPVEGHKAYFHRPDRGLLHAAGIWVHPDGADLPSAVMLTRPAFPYVMEHGHHRSPLLLSETGIDEWLDPRSIEHEIALATLRTYATSPELTHTVESVLKSVGKGRDAAIKKREEQVASSAACQSECGF